MFLMQYSTESQEKIEDTTLLAFPWHELGIQKTLTSSRAQSYLRWLMRQPHKRKLRYLDKVLGLTQHRYRSQYPKHLQRPALGKLEPLVQEGTQTMSLDLGNLLGTLGSQYISARWGQAPVPQVMAPTFQAQGPAAGIAPTPVLAPAVGMGLGALAGEAYDYLTAPSLPTIPGAPMAAGCPPPSYCVDGKTGKVTIKQKRRRRRRLATSSDIRDLSSLKSVLSPADLKMWIATHPS